MADADFLIEILARLRDEASPGLAKLKAEINSIKGTQDAENAEKDLGNAIKGTGEEADRSKRKHEGLRTEHEKSRRAADDAGRGVRSLSEDLERGRKSVDAHAESMSAAASDQERFAKSSEEVLKGAKEAGDGVEDLHLRMSKLKTSWSNFDNLLRNGELTKGQAKRGLQEYSSEFSSLMKKIETGSQEWKHLEAILDNVNRKLRNPTSGKSFESLNDSLSGAGSGLRITGVASFLQGLKDLSLIAISPQLITGVASLAGGLFSVASAAVQAGSALAGAFVSGLGQAIPMLSIVAASIERFKNILQAVSVAGQAEQQHFYDPTEKQVLQLQQSSQLISSNQQLSNSYIQLFEAQQRVRDSQIALTEARYTAQRQITELALAEKNARLQAEGANISLTESKRQLQIAIQRGDVAGLQQAELAVREAELNKKKADFEIPKTEREARLARERGVSGAPSVISAVRGLEGSRLAVVQAQQSAEAAQRQKQIIDLQRQARSSKETQFEAQLKFFEKGMSPTELGLTNALIGIEKELKSPNSPLKRITNYFVEPFTNAIERIRSLLKNSSFLRPLDELAKSMGAGLGRLEKAAFGKEGTSFFEQMARDAKENIPIVSQSIERIMKVFEDIAKAAGPAFHKLSEDWDKFWGKLDIKYGTPIGFSLLEKFFNKSVEYAEAFGKLGKALYGLFISIGHDAAPQGLSTVTGFTGAVKSATEWVKSHGPEVTKFFKEAREGLETIGGLLFTIGKDFLEAFSLSSLRALSGFLSQFLLPGLRDVINIIGKITTAVLDFFNLFGSAGRKALEVLAAFVLGTLGLIKVIAFINELRKAIIELWATIVALEGLAFWTAIGAGIVAAAAALGLFDSAQKKTKITTEEINNALERQAEALRTIKSLNDEYASSKLSVEEANLRVTQSEQTLARAKHSLAHPERPLSREERAEAVIGIKQDEQSVTRARLSAREAQENFEKLPEQQRETAKKETSVARKSAAEARALNKQNTEELRSLEKERTEAEQKISKGREVGGSIGHEIEVNAKSEVVKINEKIVSSNKKLKESQESLGTAVLRENEAINSSNALTSQGASKYSTAFAEAFSKFEESVRKGASSAHDGMGKIRKLVDDALKKYGVTPAEIASGSSAIGKVSSGISSAGRAVSKGLEGFASGGYIPAKSGGQIARVGEGGHDEVVLSTDPKYAGRSRALLGQYFSRAPHMAAGGYIYPFHGGATKGRTDQGIDYDLTPGSPITSIGDAKIKGIISNWFKGQSFLWYELLSGLDKGKNVYIAEQINRLSQVGSTVRAGQPIAYYAPSGTGLEIGWATSSGQTLAQATTGYREGQVTPAGASFGAFISGLQQGKVVGGLQAFKEIIAPKVKGGGIIGQISQRALNLAAKAANIYLEKHISSGGEANFAGVSGHGGAPSANEALGKRMMVAAGWPVGMWPSLQALWTQESGWNANSVNSSSGAYGIPQSLGHGHPYNLGDARAQIAWGLNYIRERYGSPVAAEAHERAFNWYAKGGVIQAVREFAAGGRAPWGGRPVPIIAHEGERIMNPAQYNATASLAGISPRGLDKYLGYDGSPRQNFAAGGGPIAIGQRSQPMSEFEPNLISQFTNIIFEIGNISNILKSFNKVKKAFSKLKKSSGENFVKNLEKIINEIVIETNGVLARLQEGREFFKARLERKSVEKEYTAKGGKIQLGSKGQIGIAEFSEKNLAEESKYLQTEQKIIDKAISETRKIKPKNQKQAQAKSTALKTLAVKQKELLETIDQNVEARYQAEAQTIQAKITEANNQYQVSSQEQQTKISKAQAFGNLGEVGKLEEQTATSAQAQISRLTPMLEQAQKIGNKELESSIKQEIIGLQQTINTTVIERISNAQTLIQRESAQAESKVGRRLGIAKVLSAEGRYSAANAEEEVGLKEKGTNLLNTRAVEEKLKEQALREGDTAAAITLGEELEKNSVEIAENNLALKNNAAVTRELVLSQIGRETGVGTGIYGALRSGIETIGKTTGFTNVAALITTAKGEGAVLGAGEKKYEETGTEMGFQTVGMTAQQVLQYLTSPEAQSIISRIETTGTEAEKADLEKWLFGIEGNSVAILKNTEELARLNGQLNQPQSFSTAAFNAFRTSFFTGMGGLLEPYSAALPPGSRPEGLPVYGSGQVGAPMSSTHIENINLTHPVEKLHPGLLGEELSYHISVTPPTS
jgi:hypothetical protein